MSAVGIALIIIGLVWLAIALQMDVGQPGSGYVNLDLLQRRTNHLIIGGLTTVSGILLLGFGSLQFRVGPESSNYHPHTRENPPCARDLDNEQYKVWLVSRYSITRHEVLSKYLCADKLFSSIDEALVHAHQSELQAISEKEELDKKKNAARLSEIEAANKAEKERKEQARAWISTNKKFIIGSSLVAASIACIVIANAIISNREREAEIALLTQEVERLEVQSRSTTAEVAAATQAYQTMLDAVRKSLIEPELRKLEFTLKIVDSIGSYAVTVRNGSSYYLKDLRGRLKFTVAGHDWSDSHSFRCCEEARDRNGFEMGYSIPPGGSSSQEEISIKYMQSVESAERRKFVNDRRIPTVRSFLGSQEVRFDRRVKFEGTATFIKNPVAADRGAVTYYHNDPVNFEAMALEDPRVTGLLPRLEEVKKAAEEISTLLTAKRARLNSLKQHTS